MHNQDPIVRLFAAGLYAVPDDPDYVCHFVQHLAEQTREHSFFRYCSIKRFSPEIKHDERGRLDFPLQVNWLIREKMWCLFVVQGHGGFHENDFVCQYRSFDDVVDTILDYYFGSPEIVDGWEVPFHRHPEIMKTQAKKAITEAKLIQRSEFEKIRAQRKLHYVTQGIEYSWEVELQTNFHLFSHQTKRDSVCALLRNGQEAYIIID